jgi:hypothetical protein
MAPGIETQADLARGQVAPGGLKEILREVGRFVDVRQGSAPEVFERPLRGGDEARILRERPEVTLVRLLGLGGQVVGPAEVVRDDESLQVLALRRFEGRSQGGDGLGIGPALEIERPQHILGLSAAGRVGGLARGRVVRDGLWQVGGRLIRGHRLAVQSGLDRGTGRAVLIAGASFFVLLALACLEDLLQIDSSFGLLTLRGDPRPPARVTKTASALILCRHGPGPRDGERRSQSDHHPRGCEP